MIALALWAARRALNHAKHADNQHSYPYLARAVKELDRARVAAWLDSEPRPEEQP